MEKVTVKSLYRDKEKFIDQEVEISGWIKKSGFKRILDL